MTDTIAIRGVTAWACHGVLESEKTLPQPFAVDVELEVDLAPAGASDDLTESVSYADVARDVLAVLQGPSVDLLETLAARIASACLERPLVEAVTVAVHKPHAPVGVAFSDASVSVHRRRAEPVVVALGANLGDAGRTLARAVAALRPVVRDAVVSRLVETDPVGGPDQPVYLNAVLVGTTSRPSQRLLADLHAIEERFGRTREVRWGARTLDLDVIRYGDLVSDDPALTLPHPRAHERAFVLVPWLDADPRATLPVDGVQRPVAELLASLDSSGVRPGPDWPVEVTA